MEKTMVAKVISDLFVDLGFFQKLDPDFFTQAQFVRVILIAEVTQTKVMLTQSSSLA